MNNKYFYHITSEENLPKILSEGLKPLIGESSAIVEEEVPAIYLCRYEDLPYWKAILGKTIELQITGIDIPEENHWDYSFYNEYLHFHPIPACQIRRVFTPSITQPKMKELCLSYMWTINKVTEWFARYYTNPDCGLDETELSISLNGLLAVLPNLQYHQIDKKDIREELRYCGEEACAYTFLDYYMDTDRRLYEQLLFYPEDGFSAKRKELHDYIKTTFKGCLNVNTGGWTG